MRRVLLFTAALLALPVAAQAQVGQPVSSILHPLPRVKAVRCFRGISRIHGFMDTSSEYPRMAVSPAFVLTTIGMCFLRPRSPASGDCLTGCRILSSSGISTEAAISIRNSILRNMPQPQAIPENSMPSQYAPLPYAPQPSAPMIPASSPVQAPPLEITAPVYQTSFQSPVPAQQLPITVTPGPVAEDGRPIHVFPAGVRRQ